ncbi:MAG: 13E12 repeat family protein, partial [Candidatus Dormibacteraeota bacterium]|nr:13E12 repeat family protein [Candidatus Dormibacteraeota bacterium]
CSGLENRTSQELVDELNRILDRLGGEELFSLPGESLGDDIKQLLRIGNRIDAEAGRRLRRFDKDRGYAASGALTAQAWVRWQCNLSGGAASERVEVARVLDSLPQTAQAFSEGSISYRHAALISRTAEKLGDKMESHAEEILVTAAKDLDPLRLRCVTMHLRHCLQPDDVLGDANEAHERRYLYLSQTLDGIFRLDGQLDADGGAALKTVLESLMGPPAEDDRRTATQRRADAMTELARRQLDGGRLPEVGGQKPHLMVTVDAATLSKQPGSQAAELEWAQPRPLGASPATVRSRRCFAVPSRTRSKPGAPAG